MYGNTQMAIMSLLPILWIFENLEYWAIRTVRIWSALLRDNKKSGNQNVTPMIIERGTSDIQS